MAFFLLLISPESDMLEEGDVMRSHTRVPILMVAAAVFALAGMAHGPFTPAYAQEGQPASEPAQAQPASEPAQESQAQESETTTTTETTEYRTTEDFVANPLWIALGAIAVIALVALAVSAARGGSASTTVVKESETRA